MTPPGWDPVDAVAGCPVQQWSGECWRGHNRIYPAGSYEGSRRISGRFHQAPDCFPEGPTWPALYLALSEATALLEIARQYEANDWPPKNRRFTRLQVRLSVVVDCSDPRALGLLEDDICKDPDDRDADPCHTDAWETPRQIAQAAIGLGAEAILVPSASHRGTNLIVFPGQLRGDSSIEVAADYFEPRWSRRG